jgi:hypothetical protein
MARQVTGWGVMFITTREGYPGDAIEWVFEEQVD